MSYFQLKIDIFHSLTPHLSCKLVRDEVGGGGGGGRGGGGGGGGGVGGWGCECRCGCGH